MTRLLPPLDAGGLLPEIRFEHQRSTVDGSTVKVHITWLRVGAEVGLHLPFGSLNPEYGPKWWRFW